MDNRRSQTRFVKLPGLPEILSCNSRSGRVIDATPKATQRSSQRSQPPPSLATNSASATTAPSSFPSQYPSSLRNSSYPTPVSNPLPASYMTTAFPSSNSHQPTRSSYQTHSPPAANPYTGSMPSSMRQSFPQSGPMPTGYSVPYQSSIPDVLSMPTSSYPKHVQHQYNPAEIENLKLQLELLSQKVKELERNAHRSKPPSPPPQEASLDVSMATEEYLRRNKIL